MIFIVLILQPDYGFSIPLPATVHRDFTASFQWSEDEIGNWTGNNTHEVLLSGSIDFILINQIEREWTTVDEVYWSFSGQSVDGSLAFSGNFNNETQLEWIPPDADHIPWRSDWSETIIINEDLSGFNNPWMGPSAVFSGPDWNVTENTSFLPSNLWFEAFDEMHIGRLNIDLLPVPEPSTILLIGVGLLGMIGEKYFTFHKLSKKN